MSEPIGVPVPGFEILGELRRDRLGVVYRARQRYNNRLVALRLMGDEALGGSKDLVRICHEARAAAALQHPNLLAIYEVGDAEGVPYLATELVESETLKQRLIEGPLPPREAAGLLEILARALHFAHERHVVHLDVNPAEVFLTDGTPRLGGLGLSAFLDGASDPAVSAGGTRRQALLEAPGHVAPEQIVGPASAIGPLSDVYALGVLLYEMLTGRPPFLADSPEETLRQERSAAPLPPSLLQSAVPRDLETICLKCLRWRPRSRYPSAAALANDLRRFLDGQPIQSWPTAQAARLGRWCRRNVLAVGAATAVVALLGLALADARSKLHEAEQARAEIEAQRKAFEDRERYAVQQSQLTLAVLNTVRQEAAKTEQEAREAARLHQEAQRSLEEREKALAEIKRQRDLESARRTSAEEDVKRAEGGKQEAVRRRAEVVGQLVRLHVARGAELLDDNNLAEAALWFTEALRLANSEKLPEENLRLRLAALLGQIPRPVQVWHHDKPITAVALSPDSRRVATASTDGAVTLRDTATGKPVGDPLQHESPVTQLIFSPDGKRLVTATFGPMARTQTAHVWDLAENKQAAPPLEHAGRITGLAFSSDGRRLLTVSLKGMEYTDAGEARVWEAATGELIGGPLEHRIAAGLPAFSPDGHRVLTACADRCARVWNVGDGKQVGPALEQGTALTAVAFGPDGKVALTAGADGTARTWRVDTGKPITPSLRHGSAVTKALLSYDGGRVLTMDGNAVRLWDAASGNPVGQALRHGDAIGQVSFSLDGRHVLTAGADGAVRVWSAATGEPVLPPLQQGGSVAYAAFSSSGSAVVTLAGPLVRVWDLTAGGSTPTARRDNLHSGPAWFSPDGRREVRVSGTNVRIYDQETGKLLGPALQHRYAVRAAAFSPDGNRLLTIVQPVSGDEAEGAVRLWDVATGKQIGNALEHLKPVTRALFGPDGRNVLTVCADQKVRLWDAASSGRIGEEMDHNTAVGLALFSPDGSRILTTSADGGVHLWEARTGRRATDALDTEGVTVLHAAFSPDGKQIVTAGADGTARVWDGETGKPRTPPLRHAAEVTRAAFSPDGRQVVTASQDRTARVWDAGTGQPRTPPLRHPGPVGLAVFSADGRRVVTTSGNRARVWDLTDGAALSPWLVLAPRGVALTSISLGAEGRLVSATGLPGDPRGRQVRDLKPDTRSVEDLERLALVLAGHHLEDRTGATEGAAELTKTWQAVRIKNLADFTVPTERLQAWERSGAEECEQGRLWPGAVQHLTRLIEYEPTREDLRIRRARAYASLRQWEAARDDYAKALETKTDRPELWTGRAEAHAALRSWEAATADYSRAIQLKPDDVDLRLRRGEVEAEHGRWREAAADFAEATKRGRNEAILWRRHALACLASGDLAGYKQACVRLAKRGGDTEADARAIAWVCALAPDAVNNYRLLLQRAERRATANPKSTVDLLAWAILLYRAGQFDPALQHVQEAAALNGSATDPRAELLRALVQQRLQHPEEARQALDKALGQINAAKEKKEAIAPTWEQRLEIEILRREVETEIKKG
jgi:WD40 repeat protein/tetratricopeptide (TPR) repeat protein